MNVQTSSPIDPRLASMRDIWVECFRSVLGQVAAFPITVEPEGDEESAEGAEGEDAAGTPEVWERFKASKALQGEMAILSTEAGAVQLAEILMSEPINLATPLDQDHREAYEELLSQVLGQVATGLKISAGGDVEIKPSGKDAPAWQNATRAGIRIAGEKLSPIRLNLLLEPELAGGLQKPEEKSVPPASKLPEEPMTEPEMSAGQNANLQLLLDVTLDATICFGQKQMLLRDILDLHPGAAVALDRHVAEPVDLLVGGRIMARGEVVIVDGNYGLRITEIISSQQRILSLGK